MSFDLPVQSVSRKHASPRPAATVALVRDAAGRLEVFLVRRHDNVAFMGGAHVFPGGRVDESDRLTDPDAHCDGTAAARARLGAISPGDAVAFHVAAIRELFEEAGVLLARDGRGAIVAIDEDASARFDGYRRQMMAGQLTLVALAERERIRIALDTLALFAHWVTPEVELRRYDTRFFLAVAPAVQRAAHDRHETTEGTWMAPDEAIARCLRGEIALPPPTWTTLRALSKRRTVASAWEWALAQRVPRIQPCFARREDGTRLVMLPGDPQCPAVDGFDAEERRFLLADGRWTPVAPA